MTSYSRVIKDYSQRAKVPFRIQERQSREKSPFRIQERQSRENTPFRNQKRQSREKSPFRIQERQSRENSPFRIQERQSREKDSARKQKRRLRVNMKYSKKKHTLKKRKRYESQPATGSSSSEQIDNRSNDVPSEPEPVSKLGSASDKDDKEQDSNSDDDGDSNPECYLSKREMPHDLREALRLEVKFQYRRLPVDCKLDLNQTFEQQSNLVNEVIVPNIMESLNKTIFPIVSGIIYNMIHSLHRHQREECRIRERSPEYIDKQKRRKHFNSRRNFKRTTRAKMINHLRKAGDPLVEKFHDDCLQPVLDENAYHSPEISETDEEESGKRKVVIKDLKWRSSTCRLFLRNYIDRMISEKSKVPKKRKFVYDNENFYDKEEVGPVNAPSWTCTKYKGQLKAFVRNACNRSFGNELPISPNNNHTV